MSKNPVRWFEIYVQDIERAKRFYDSRLRGHFAEEQIMELSAHIAFENYRARWNRVFDVGSDELYKPGAQHR